MFNFLLLAELAFTEAGGPLETPQCGTTLPVTKAAPGLVWKIKRSSQSRGAAEIAGNSLFLALTVKTPASLPAAASSQHESRGGILQSMAA